MADEKSPYRPYLDRTTRQLVYIADDYIGSLDPTLRDRYRPVDEAEHKALKVVRDNPPYSMGQAALGGVETAATLGTAPMIKRAIAAPIIGDEAAREVQLMEEYAGQQNPQLKMAGEMAATIGPAVITGGASLLGGGARAGAGAAARAAAPGFTESLLGTAAGEAVGGTALSRGLGAAAMSGLETAGTAVGEELSKRTAAEQNMYDTLLAEETWAAVAPVALTAGLYGAVTGGALQGLGDLAGAAVRRGRGALETPDVPAVDAAPRRGLLGLSDLQEKEIRLHRSGLAASAEQEAIRRGGTSEAFTDAIYDFERIARDHEIDLTDPRQWSGVGPDALKAAQRQEVIAKAAAEKRGRNLEAFLRKQEDPQLRAAAVDLVADQIEARAMKAAKEAPEGLFRASDVVQALSVVKGGNAKRLQDLVERKLGIQIAPEPVKPDTLVGMRILDETDFGAVEVRPKGEIALADPGQTVSAETVLAAAFELSASKGKGFDRGAGEALQDLFSDYMTAAGVGGEAVRSLGDLPMIRRTSKDLGKLSGPSVSGFRAGGQWAQTGIATGQPIQAVAGGAARVAADPIAAKMIRTYQDARLWLGGKKIVQSSKLEEAAKALAEPASEVKARFSPTKALGAVISGVQQGRAKATARMTRHLVDKEELEERYDTAIDAIAKYKADPQLAHEAATELSDFDDDPMTAVRLGQQLDRIITELDSRRPRVLTRKQQHSFQPLAEENKPYPTVGEMRRYLRIIDAANNPMDIYEGIAAGEIDKDAVEAVKAIYPQMWHRFQMMALTHIAATPRPLPYDRKVQLSMLFDIVGDPTMAPDFIQLSQSVWRSPPPQQQGPGGPPGGQSPSPKPRGGTSLGKLGDQMMTTLDGV